MSLTVPFLVRSWVERYHSLSLRTKFALHIVLSIALLFAVLLPSVVYLQERTVLDEARERGLELTKIFAHSSVQAIVSDDFLTMRQVINSIASEPSVLHAMILEPSGRVIAHSNIRETGRTYTDALSRRAARAERFLLQEVRRPALSAYDFAVPIYVLNDRRAVARVGISLEKELAAIRRTRNLVFGLGVLTLGAGLALALWQAHSVIRPLGALVSGAKEVAAGRLARRIDTGTRDELGQLGDAFNRMAETLQVRFEADRALSSTLNVQTVLDALVHHAQKLCGADLAFLAYRERNALTARVSSCAGTTGSAISAWRIYPGRGCTGHVLADGKTLAPDISETGDPDEAQVFAEENVVKLLLAPIWVQGDCLGALGVGRRQAIVFQEDTHEALRRLADQAAVALANALAYREIEMLNLSLEGKVAERTRELSEANRKLQTLDKLKSEFVSNASHELRTPLTAIRMSVDNLLDGIAGETGPKLRRYLDTVKNNTDRLSRLVTDLLDLSRIEAGRVELHRTSVPVLALIQEVAENLGTMAARKGLALHVSSSDTTLVAFADRDKLQQVLINLIGNAVKFTPDGGRIILTARAADSSPMPFRSPVSHEYVEVAVEDTGEGIPPDELPAIFDKFYQVRREGQARPQGTGLGLAIAKSLIELHGGRIWVESQIGRGTRFVFSLPMTDSAAVAEAGKAAGVMP
jgi:two-component system sensor histidine kinase/response regulator